MRVFLAFFLLFLVYLREQDTPSLQLPSFFHSVQTIFWRKKNLPKKASNLQKKIAKKATIWRGKTAKKEFQIFFNRRGNCLNISENNK
jgi:hypothetical protein